MSKLAAAAWFLTAVEINHEWEYIPVLSLRNLAEWVEFQNHDNILRGKETFQLDEVRVAEPCSKRTVIKLMTMF